MNQAIAAPGDRYAVTGSFGYSGKYITARLLSAGKRVRTLTNSPHRNHPFGNAVEIFPCSFDKPDELVRSLAGVDALINTYWVRFEQAGSTHSRAVANSLRLFEAAAQAGVSRIVHVSITHPSIDSPLPYFRGKAEVEEALRNSGMCWAILRPAVLFGEEDILINNIAWMLRRFPVFAVFGDGAYELQPIFVDDFAQLAVHMADSREPGIIDAVGPETFSYRGLVETIGKAIGRPRPILQLPPQVGLALARLIGWIVGDVIITRDEVSGLMQNLLVTGSVPAGRTALSEWVRAHRGRLGLRYSSELARRRDRRRSYEQLRRPAG